MPGKDSFAPTWTSLLRIHNHFFQYLVGFAPWICIATPNMYTHRHDCMCTCYWVGACVIGCGFWLIRTKVWVSLFYLTNGLGRLAIILSFISIIIWRLYSVWLPRKWRNIGGIIRSVFWDIYVSLKEVMTLDSIGWWKRMHVANYPNNIPPL